MRSLALTILLAAPVRAQLSGCQYTSGTLQLQKVRSTASGTQIFGCLNASFDILSSSLAVAASTSATTFLSSVTIKGAGGLGVTYGVSIGTLATTGGVNIGTTAATTNGRLQVFTGASGATAHVNADEIVAEGSGNSGVSILTPNNATGAIYFGDPQDATVGQIGYNHSTNDMAFQTAAGNRLNVLGTGDVHVVNNLMLGTTTVSGLFHIAGTTPRLVISAMQAGNREGEIRWAYGTVPYWAAGIDIRQANNNYFSISDVQAGTNLITVSTMGFVGVKNLDPTVALDVTGDVRGTNLRGPLVGITDASAATAGTVGEYVGASTTSYTNWSCASGSWCDGPSITLSPGDWDVSMTAGAQLNASVMTTWGLGAGTAVSPDNTGISQGVNQFSCILPTAANSTSCSVASFRSNSASTVIWYMKLNATWSGATPQMIGTISARRVR